MHQEKPSAFPPVVGAGIQIKLLYMSVMKVYASDELGYAKHVGSCLFYIHGAITDVSFCTC